VGGWVGGVGGGGLHFIPHATATPSQLLHKQFLDYCCDSNARRNLLRLIQGKEEGEGVKHVHLQKRVGGSPGSAAFSRPCRMTWLNATCSIAPDLIMASCHGCSIRWFFVVRSSVAFAGQNFGGKLKVISRQKQGARIQAPPPPTHIHQDLPLCLEYPPGVFGIGDIEGIAVS